MLLDHVTRILTLVIQDLWIIRCNIDTLFDIQSFVSIHQSGAKQVLVEENADYWKQHGEDELQEALNLQPNTNIAKVRKLDIIIND